jgi:hypothetical protein
MSEENISEFVSVRLVGDSSSTPEVGLSILDIPLIASAPPALTDRLYPKVLGEPSVDEMTVFELELRLITGLDDDDDDDDEDDGDVVLLLLVVVLAFEKNDLLTFGQPLRGVCSLPALFVAVNREGLVALSGLVQGSAGSDNFADSGSGFERKCTESAGPRRFFMPQPSLVVVVIRQQTTTARKMARAFGRQRCSFALCSRQKPWQPPLLRLTFSTTRAGLKKSCVRVTK